MDKENGYTYLRGRYYDSATGRFISEDPSRSGTNWYTYCDGNPVQYVDPSGLDAILINKPLTTRTTVKGKEIVDIGAITGIEHMSAFFQDKDKNWYFFFYGTTVHLIPVEDNSIFNSMDSINKWLLNSAKGYVLDPRDLYRSATYVKGDFTTSLEKAIKINDSYEDKRDKFYKANPTTDKKYFNEDYNTVANNCTQVTMSLFYMGTLPNGTNVGDYAKRNGHGINVFPDVNLKLMQEIFYNKATNLKEFNSAIQIQQDKLDKYKNNSLARFWYPTLKSNINTIK